MENEPLIYRISDERKLRRPDFIPQETFRAWLRPSPLNKYLRIDGMLASSYVSREERMGRPFKTRGTPVCYRLVDLVVRAHVNCLSIAPPEEIEIARSIAQLKQEESEARAALEVAKHDLGLNLASIALTNATLLNEAEIVAGSVQYKPKCGVYFLITGKKVRYVGQSVNVEIRIRDHMQRFEFESVAYIPCESAILDRMESLYIHMLRPDWNGRLNTREGDLPVAPLTLAHLLGGTEGSSMSAVKAMALNRKRLEGVR